jgi:ATP-dependent Lon protease
MAKILKLLVLPDGNTTIIIQGQSRFQIEEELQNTPYLTARVSYTQEVFPNKNSKEVKALVASLKDAAAKMLRLNPEIPQEASSPRQHRVALLPDALPFVQHQRGSGAEAEAA